MIVVSSSIISMVIFTCGDSNLGPGHHRRRNDSGVGGCFCGGDCDMDKQPIMHTCAMQRVVGGK